MAGSGDGEVDVEAWLTRRGNIRFEVEEVSPDGVRSLGGARLVRADEPIVLDYMPCEACGQTMNYGVGCTVETLTINGVPMLRVPWNGGSRQFYGYCHDCNVAPGQLHHLQCDVESCPACGHQLISCDCDCAELPDDEDGEA